MRSQGTRRVISRSNARRLAAAWRGIGTWQRYMPPGPTARALPHAVDDRPAAPRQAVVAEDRDDGLAPDARIVVQAPLPLHGPAADERGPRRAPAAGAQDRLDEDELLPRAQRSQQ